MTGDDPARGESSPHDPLVGRAYEVFQADLDRPPPLTLRGGNAVDSYDRAQPFHPIDDEPSDTYFERFAFWGLAYLDGQSWRHYLARLMDYAARHPDDPAMVTEALVRSMRPPDRYPPRLATLTADQESAVREFLEQAALGRLCPSMQTEAQQALEEWWLPNPRSRPTSAEVDALRAAPVAVRVVEGDIYRLSVPETLTASGLREIPAESRRVQTWGGYLCGDAHTMVAVNVTPLALRSLPDSARTRAALFRGGAYRRPVAVRGSPLAERLDGLAHGDSPAEPQTLVLVLAAAGDELVTLSIRSWPREDLDREVARIVDSFEIVS